MKNTSVCHLFPWHQVQCFACMSKKIRSNSKAMPHLNVRLWILEPELEQEALLLNMTWMESLAVPNFVTSGSDGMMSGLASELAWEGAMTLSWPRYSPFVMSTMSESVALMLLGSGDLWLTAIVSYYHICIKSLSQRMLTVLNKNVFQISKTKITISYICNHCTTLWIHTSNLYCLQLSESDEVNQRNITEWQWISS